MCRGVHTHSREIPADSPKVNLNRYFNLGKVGEINFKCMHTCCKLLIDTLVLVGLPNQGGHIHTTTAIASSISCKADHCSAEEGDT